MLHWYDFLLRLSVALLGGALIGLERQWRSRGAGLRTNTLVAAGAAMFVLISHMTPSGSNPTQVTAYVSGVGFLGAGVIISDGARVRGINTAATLWCAAAVGALAASGFVWQAGVATATVLGINILLRPIGRRTDRQTGRRRHGGRDCLPPPRDHTRQERGARQGAAPTSRRRSWLPAARPPKRRHRRNRPSRGQRRTGDPRPPRRTNRNGRRPTWARAERDPHLRKFGAPKPLSGVSILAE